MVLILKGGVKVGAGKTKNISFQGLFVRSAYRPPLHQLLEIQFADLQGAADTVLQAHVVHSHSDGFGVEIDDAIEHDRLLNSLLRQRAERDKRYALTA